MNYDDWKTTPPADDEPDVEACGHRVGTCEGECRLDTEPAPALEHTCDDDVPPAYCDACLLEPAPALEEESETMTPKELLEDAANVDMAGFHGAADALRSYAELVACLSWRREQGLGGSVDVVAESKALGWPGLEEL